MFQIPAHYSVTVLPRITGATDAHGKPVVRIATLDSPEAIKASVFAWHTVERGLPETKGDRQAVTTTLHLYAPPDFPAGPKDAVLIPGYGIFDVVGEPEQWHGPWGSSPAKRYLLEKVGG